VTHWSREASRLARPPIRNHAAVAVATEGSSLHRRVASLMCIAPDGCDSPVRAREVVAREDLSDSPYGDDEAMATASSSEEYDTRCDRTKPR